jgi:23S rRNA A2030 N6-methylase RlmJ
MANRSASELRSGAMIVNPPMLHDEAFRRILRELNCSLMPTEAAKSSIALSAAKRSAEFDDAGNLDDVLP